ncbi:hypothetical protein ACEN3Z_00450 [Ruoffia sp. FAM 26254]
MQRFGKLNPKIFFNEVISNLDSLGADYTLEDNSLSFNDTSGLGVIVELVPE